MRLPVRVIPNARRTEFFGRREGEVVLRLNAPALEGKANKAAIDFIAKYFGLRKYSLGERTSVSSGDEILAHCSVGLLFLCSPHQFVSFDR